MDMSFVLIHSFLSVFLVLGLEVSLFAVGLIEGIAECFGLLTKVLSGLLRDFCHIAFCVSHGNTISHLNMLFE